MYAAQSQMLSAVQFQQYNFINSCLKLKCAEASTEGTFQIRSDRNQK